MNNFLESLTGRAWRYYAGELEYWEEHLERERREGKTVAMHGTRDVLRNMRARLSRIEARACREWGVP